MGSRDHSIECGWCGYELYPSLRSVRAPSVGAIGFHFSCIESLEQAARTLASNLAIGALGCWGFHRGVMYGMAASNVICSQDSPDEWYPGRALDERPCRNCQRRFVPTTEDFGPDWCGCDEQHGASSAEEEKANG